MPSKFGGVPVAAPSGSKFGGVPVSEGPAAPFLIEGRIPRQVEDEYWQAEADGDKPKAAELFKQLRAAGIRMGPAPAHVIEAGKRRTAESMSAPQQFIASAADRFIDLGASAGQLAMSHWGGGLPGGAEALEASKAAVTERHQNNRALHDTGWGFTGAIAGDVAPIVATGLTGAYLKSPMLMAAALPRTVPGAMVQGAILGGSRPLETGEGEGTRLMRAGAGATVGGAVQSAVPVAAWTGNKLARLSPAFTERMQREQAARILLSNAHDPAALRAALNRNNVIIRGTNQSTAEATGDVGLAGLQRTLANTPEFGNRLAMQNMGNNATRVQTVRGAFGNVNSGSEEAQRLAVQTAQGTAINEAKRQTGAETMRVVTSLDRALKSPRFINNPDVAQKLATVRGLITTPLDDAARLSAARGVVKDAIDGGFRKSAANHEALLEARRIVYGAQARGEAADDTIKALRAIKADGQTKTVIGDMQRALRTVERGKPDVASLYNARKHITQKLMASADAETMTALRGIVKNLDDEIGKVAPTYRQYLTDYAGGMRQADQMAVGEELLGASSAIRDSLGNPQLSPAKFSNAGADLDQTVRRASGFQRATAARTMTPVQKQTVENIRLDLERLSRSQTDGKAIGSNTMQNAIGGQTLQSAAGPVGAAIIEPASGIALLALNQMRKTYGQKTFEIVQEAMLNPQEAARLIASLPANQRGAAVRAVAASIGRVAAPLGANAAVSGK